MGSESRQASSSATFVRIELRSADRELSERLVADAYAAGAVGLEEREESDGLTWDLYAPLPRAAAVRNALLSTAQGRASVGPVREVADQDWPELWKQNLSAIGVSPQLIVRPSCVDVPKLSGRAELVIDPGQAFGTGAHASTRLALEWIDRLAPGLEPGARVLDVGTGSGVLALAALRCGRGVSVGFDLDFVAAREAHANARANDLAERAFFFAGPLDAVAARGFELVVANLLRTEMEPLLAGIAARTRAGGNAVLSGLLARELSQLQPELQRAGLRTVDRREARDDSGEVWVALLTTP